MSVRIIGVLLLILCQLFIQGCDSSSGSKNHSQKPQGEYLATELISASIGGDIVVSDDLELTGTSVSIPPDALSKDSNVTIYLVENKIIEASIGSIIKVSAPDAQINGNMKITLVYSEEVIPKGLDEGSLLIAQIFEDKKLISLENISVDSENNRISGTASSLSEFVIVRSDAYGLPHKPKANAGNDQTILLGTTATLTAENTTDLNGSLLSYQWDLQKAPEGSNAVISDQLSVQPNVEIDLTGEYVIRLEVADGSSELAISEVILSTTNSKPKADAGPGQTILTGETIILDGRNSIDIDGDQLTFQWLLDEKPEDSSATLQNASSQTPTLLIDQAGKYVSKLVVNDGSNQSQSDIVIVSTENTPPVANVGNDKKIVIETSLTLDGSQSHDVDGDELFYRWSVLSAPFGSNFELVDHDSMKALFEIDSAGAYVVQLVVDDGVQKSHPDTIVLTTEEINARPSANAGADILTGAGETFILDGSVSNDVDGDVLTYRWALINKPVGSDISLSNPESVNPSAVVDKSGTYLAQLIVNDGVMDSKPSTVVITTEFAKPVANAGADQEVVVGDTLTLDGSSSFDEDGDNLNFDWSLISRPENSISVLSSRTSAAPTFTMDKAGSTVAQLIVNDGQRNSEPDTVTITTKNRIPVANAGSDKIVFSNTPTLLKGEQSTDPDGEQITFKWSVVSSPGGSSYSLLLADEETADFQADSAGEYVIELIVNDGKTDSIADQMIVTVSSQPRPIITSISPTQGSVGDLITIQGKNLVSLEGVRAKIKLANRNGGEHDAAVISATSNQVTFTIPAQSDDGEVGLDLGIVVYSNEVLEIKASKDFDIVVAPTTLAIMKGQRGTYSVSIESSTNLNRQVEFSITGLPDGLNGWFSPSKITAGQTSDLTINVPENQPLSVNSLVITAKTQIDGVEVTRSKTVSLDVQAVSTSLAGRVVLDDTGQTPLEGVIITFQGINEKGDATGCDATATTDAAGNFVFSNLPEACKGYQVLHYDAGSNVKNLPGLYAQVEQRYFIEESAVATPPGPVHLPRLDDKETVSIIQNHTEDQHFIFETIPNLEVTVYAGTTFTLKDGTSPNPFIMYAVDLESDRIPGQTPNMGNVIIPRLLAFQPDATHVSQPMAVTFPNVLGIAPGTNVPLLSLNPLAGMLMPYGTGTISANGLQIIPDFDPDNEGKRFGLTYLDWHGPRFNAPDVIPPQTPAPPGQCRPTSTNEPIDFGTGLEITSDIDLALDCSRGGIVINRTYRSLLTNDGPFGRGSGLNYNIRLDTASPQNAQSINLVMSDGSRALLSRPTVSLATGGSVRQVFVNLSNPGFIGNQLTTRSNGESSYRWKDGRIFHFVPDPRNGVSQLSAITDAKGNTVTIHRNSSQMLEITEIEDAVGRVIKFEYGSGSRISKIVDPIGREVSYTYSSRGMLETVTDAEGNTTRYEYDNQDRLLREFNALDIKQMENVYDENGRVIEQTYADAGVTKLRYILMNSAAGNSPVRTTIVTDPMGNETAYRFNPQGYLISAYNLDNNGKIGFSTASPTPGQSVISPVVFASTETIFERESGSNRLLSIKGNALCRGCGNPTNGDISFTYDAFGNRDTVTDALSNTYRFTYNNTFNKVTSITDPLGNQNFIEYNAAGNVTKITDANGNETQMEYDIHGLLSTVTDPTGAQSTISYDSFANPIKTTDPLGNEFTTRFDAISRPIANIDALGNRSQTTLDQVGRASETLDANKDTTQFLYDKAGRITSLTDARENATTYSYDDMDRVIARTDSLDKTDSREFDLNGNLVKFTDRKGQVTEFSYDDLNRLVRQKFSDESTITRQYDSRSRVIAIVDSLSGTYNYDYDAVGRVIKTISPNGTIQYEYDALGRITKQQVVGQPAVDYSYDAVGNLTSVKSTTAEESYSYDVRNQLTNVIRPNGVSTDYNYDVAGRLLSIIHSKGAEVVATQNYTHDANGQRISNSLSHAKAQITEASNNVIDDASNQLVQRGEVTYTYDDNGNRLTRTNSAGVTHYKWDARNRLTEITTAVAIKHQFIYDFSNNMISHNVTTGGVTTSESYLLDLLTNVVFQSRSSGEQFSMLTAPGIDQHIALMYGDGRISYLLRDGLNSTMATVDSSGNVNGRFYYEAFGKTTVEGEPVPFQYTGRVPVKGDLYYYRARFYDSKAGVFISQDPIGFGSGGSNLYIYTRNHPAGFIDPSGNVSEWLDGPNINPGEFEFLGESSSGGVTDRKLSYRITGVIYGSYSCGCDKQYYSQRFDEVVSIEYKLPSIIPKGDAFKSGGFRKMSPLIVWSTEGYDVVYSALGVQEAMIELYFGEWDKYLGPLLNDISITNCAL